MDMREMKMPKGEIEQSIETEVDHAFLEQGLEGEIKKAQDREAQGEKEGYGRTSLSAARNAELGIDNKIPDEIYNKMEANLVAKREALDGWGISFQARYLKLIDGDRYVESGITFSEEEQKAIAHELEHRQMAAEANPEKWAEFFAMADHVKVIAPETFEQLDLATIQSDAIAKCLEALEQRPVDYVHAALNIEECAPGTLELAGMTKEKAAEQIKAVLVEAQEAKLKGDSIRNSFALSQAKGLARVLSL